MMAHSIGGQTIRIAILPKQPLHYSVPFWKLSSHRIPVKWSLYRYLLRAAVNANLHLLNRVITPEDIITSNDHVDAIKRRWRQPKMLYCTSPNSCRKLLETEEQFLAMYTLYATGIATPPPASVILHSDIEIDRAKLLLTSVEKEIRGHKLEHRLKLAALQEYVCPFFKSHVLLRKVC